MSISLYMEVHVRRAVTTALRLRSIDVLTAQEDGSAELADDVLLERATELGRVLVSQDEDLLHEGARWLSEGKDFSGIIYSHQLRIMIGQMVDDLEMIARATSQDEWWGRSNICRFGERALLVHRTPWRLGL